MNGTMHTKSGYRSGMSVWHAAVCLLALSGIGLMGCQTTGGGGNTNVNTNVNANDNANVNENENENVNANENVNVNDNTPPPNQDPVANAGPDQAVTGGTSVALTGAGSTDADGDTLTFAWSQTGGTNAVTLAGATTATPSFTAPTADDTLTFELTVDDGNGGTATDEVVVTVTAPVVPQLFIANFGGVGTGRVTSYLNPATVDGNIAPPTNLQGAQTELNFPADVVVNSAGQLVVANFGGNSITTYNNAPATNGNLEPDGTLVGAATDLDDPTSLAYNIADDLVFVADFADDEILVFGNTATLNGNTAPTRTITSAGNLNNPTGINFGANDDLYVANSGLNNVLVFAGASNLNGNIAPTRTITSAAFTAVFDVFIDANDNLFVLNTTGTILIFTNAAGLNGNESPDFTLTVTGAAVLSAIVVDANDTGYIVDNAAAAVYSYENISTLNGARTPDNTISGANTLLFAPIRLFLLE